MPARGWAPNGRRGLRAGAWARPTASSGGTRTGLAPWAPSKRDPVPNRTSTSARRRLAAAAAPAPPRASRVATLVRPPPPTPAPRARRPRRPRPPPQDRGEVRRRVVGHPDPANGGHLDVVRLRRPHRHRVRRPRPARRGRRAHGLNQAIAYLKTQLTDALQASDGNDDPGSLGYWIMAAVSAGAGPAALRRHQASEQPRRPAAGHRADDRSGRRAVRRRPTRRTTGRSGRASRSQRSRRPASPRPTPAVTWAIALADARSSARTGCGRQLPGRHRHACPAADPDTFAGPDTNSTGMAAQGLAAYGMHPHAAPMLTALRRSSPRTAGSRSSRRPARAPTRTRRPCRSRGSSPPAARRPRRAGACRGATPYTALASFQLGCADPAADRGAFFFPGDRSPNILASVQSVPAAAGVTLPLPASTLSYGGAGQPSPVRARRGTASVQRRRRSAATALAGTAGKCPGKTGVTVAVDFKAFGGGVPSGARPGRRRPVWPRCSRPGSPRRDRAVRAGVHLPDQQQADGRGPDPARTRRRRPRTGRTTTRTRARRRGRTARSARPRTSPLQGSIEGWAFGAKAKPSKTPAQIRAGA